MEQGSFVLIYLMGNRNEMRDHVLRYVSFAAIWLFQIKDGCVPTTCIRSLPSNLRHRHRPRALLRRHRPPADTATPSSPICADGPFAAPDSAPACRFWMERSQFTAVIPVLLAVMLLAKAALAPPGYNRPKLFRGIGATALGAIFFYASTGSLLCCRR